MKNSQHCKVERLELEGLGRSVALQNKPMREK